MSSAPKCCIRVPDFVLCVRARLGLPRSTSIYPTAGAPAILMLISVVLRVERSMGVFSACVLSVFFVPDELFSQSCLLCVCVCDLSVFASSCVPSGHQLVCCFSSAYFAPSFLAKCLLFSFLCFVRALYFVMC